MLKALFAGQVYDLPDALAADWLEILPDGKALEPVQDKAVRPQRNKSL